MCDSELFFYHYNSIRNRLVDIFHLKIIDKTGSLVLEYKKYMYIVGDFIGRWVVDLPFLNFFH